jgi:hypothetical protein
MDLRGFVRASLIDIVSGVQEAQATVTELGGLLNPGMDSSSRTFRAHGARTDDDRLGFPSLGLQIHPLQQRGKARVGPDRARLFGEANVRHTKEGEVAGALLIGQIVHPERFVQVA